MCWLNVLKHVLCYKWLINGILTVCWEGKHKNSFHVGFSLQYMESKMEWYEYHALICYVIT